MSSLDDLWPTLVFTRERMDEPDLDFGKIPVGTEVFEAGEWRFVSEFGEGDEGGDDV